MLKSVIFDFDHKSPPNFELNELVTLITLHSLPWLPRSRPDYLISILYKPSVIFRTKSFLIP